MADDQKRGPGRPRKDTASPVLETPEDERETTEKPTDGRPQTVGYVNPEVPDHPDFHDNPLVEIRTDAPDYAGAPGPRPKGTMEVEILRRYVPAVVVNEAGNAVSDGEGGFVKQDNAVGGRTLPANTIVRLPNKEAAYVIKAGIATTTENTFDGED